MASSIGNQGSSNHHIEMSPISLDKTSGPKQAEALQKKDLKISNSTKQKAVKFKYINKTREQVISTAKSRGNKANWVLGLAGVAGAAFIACKVILGTSILSSAITAGLTTAASAAAASAAAAAMVTPVGWAVLGLVAVGLGIIALRHIYMKSHGLNTNTGMQLLKSAGAAAAGLTIGIAFIAGLVASCLGLDKVGALNFSFFRGGAGGGISDAVLFVAHELSKTEGGKGGSVTIQENKNSKFAKFEETNTVFLYKNDEVKRGIDGSVSITPLGIIEEKNNEIKLAKASYKFAYDRTILIKAAIRRFKKSNGEEEIKGDQAKLKKYNDAMNMLNKFEATKSECKATIDKLTKEISELNNIKIIFKEEVEGD